MSTTAGLHCYVCGTLADTSFRFVVKVDGVEVPAPQRVILANRGPRESLGLCSLRFAARRFDGFTADEMACFQEEFTKADDASNA